MQVRNHAGATKNNMTCTGRAPSGGRPGAWWYCCCELCGRVKSVQGVEFARGAVTCECRPNPRIIDYAGQRHYRWTFDSISEEKGANGCALWNVTCDCGTKAVRYGPAITSGHSKSCGCYQNEHRGEHAKTHGKSRSPAHRVWVGMRQRCNCILDPDYGGRGIRVCDRWSKFENFAADMGERPADMTIDRIDADRGYSCGKCDDCRERGEPSNCRWATRKTQSRNRRNTVLLTLGGVTRPATEWAEIIGLKPATIYRRLRMGHTIEEVLAPANPGGKRKKSNRFLTHDGKTLPIYQWAEVTGIPRKVITLRIFQGWDAARAITTPYKSS